MSASPARRAARGRSNATRLRPGGAPWAALAVVVGLLGALAVGSAAAAVGLAVLVVLATQLPLLLPPVDPPVAPSRRDRGAGEGADVVPDPGHGERRRRARACAVAGVAWSALLAPVLWRVAHGPVTGFLFSDWALHLQYVPGFRLRPLVIPIPHFLFELSTRIVAELTSVSIPTAGVIATVGFVGATGASLAWFFQRPWVAGGRRPGPWLAAGCSVAFVLSELPQFTFFGTTALRDDLVNVSIHQWNTPSTVTAESFQILLLVGAVAALTQVEGSGRIVRWLPWLAVLTMVAKPSVPLVLAAAVVPWALRGRAPGWAWKRGLLGLVVPVAVMTVVQLYIGAVWWEADVPSGLAFEPGGVLTALDPWGPGLAAFVLPGLALLVGGRELLRHPALRLAGWALVAGLVATGSIVETGLRAEDGNVARTAFAGYWLVYLCLLRWVLDLWQRRLEWPSWSTRERVGSVLVALYVVLTMVSGTGLYLEEVGLISFTGARG